MSIVNSNGDKRDITREEYFERTYLVEYERETKRAHRVHGPINARKLGKKAYRKRRKLSAAANSISAGNPGLPLLRGGLAQRASLQPKLATSPLLPVTGRGGEGRGLNRPATRE